jgi:hypothetical protein
MILTRETCDKIREITINNKLSNEMIFIHLYLIYGGDNIRRIHDILTRYDIDKTINDLEYIIDNNIDVPNKLLINI